jgi:hypothetical protein
MTKTLFFLVIFLGAAVSHLLTGLAVHALEARL